MNLFDTSAFLPVIKKSTHKIFQIKIISTTLVLLIISSWTIILEGENKTIMKDNILQINENLYLINNEKVSQQKFEKLMSNLLIDARSHFCYETSTGGISGYRARHKDTGADVTYQTSMENEVTVFKILMAPSTAIPYKDKSAGFEFWYPPTWRIVRLEMDDCAVEVQPSDAIDPYARLDSFRVVIAKTKNSPMSTSPVVWQAPLGEGEQARSSMIFAIENTKYVLILTAREANIPVLEDILYSFRPLTNLESDKPAAKAASHHKEDIVHFNKYNEALVSGDVIDVWLGMFKAWGEAQHIIPVLNGHPLFEESIRVISGYPGLNIHTKSRKILESAVMSSRFKNKYTALPTRMFKAKKPITEISPDEMASMYRTLGEWSFVNVTFSPD